MSSRAHTLLRQLVDFTQRKYPDIRSSEVLAFTLDRADHYAGHFEADLARPLCMRRRPVGFSTSGVRVLSATAVWLDHLAAIAGQIPAGDILALLVLDAWGLSPFTRCAHCAAEASVSLRPAPAYRGLARVEFPVPVHLAAPVFDLAVVAAHHVKPTLSVGRFLLWLADRAVGFYAPALDVPRLQVDERFSVTASEARVEVRLPADQLTSGRPFGLHILAGSMRLDTVITLLVLDWCGLGPFRLHRAVTHTVATRELEQRGDA